MGGAVRCHGVGGGARHGGGLAQRVGSADRGCGGGRTGRGGAHAGEGATGEGDYPGVCTSVGADVDRCESDGDGSMSGVRVLASDELRAFCLARLVSAEQMPYFMRALFAAQTVGCTGIGHVCGGCAVAAYLDRSLLVGAGA